MSRRIDMTLRQPITQSMDVSQCRCDVWANQNADQIRRTLVQVDGQSEELGQWFDVTVADSNDGLLTIRWTGDFRHVHAIGHQHRSGHWTIEGNVGNHVGACMSGGRIDVMGDAADNAAAPMLSRGAGMNGGVLSIDGNVGRAAGQRMRRGELRISENADAGLGSLMIAGTILCGGHAGPNLGIGMRRGTIILARMADMPRDRFTPPRELQTPFQAILARRSETLSPSITQTLASKLVSTRGDRSIGGQGEVWMPESPSS